MKNCKSFKNFGYIYIKDFFFLLYQTSENTKKTKKAIYEDVPARKALGNFMQQLLIYYNFT